MNVTSQIPKADGNAAEQQTGMAVMDELDNPLQFSQSLPIRFTQTLY